YRADLDAKNACLVAVNVEEDGRGGRGERRENTCQLRILIGCDHKTPRDLREVLRCPALNILDHKGETTAGAESNDRRRLEWHTCSAAQLTKLPGQPRYHCIGAVVLPFSLLKALQRYNQEASVRLRKVVDEVQSDNRAYIRDRRFFLQNCF